MNDNNVAQLVERVKNGDKTAVDELYRIYSEPLLKFVIKQGLSEFDAQDVVSETFMSMLQHIGQLKNNEQFGTWLHTIAKRKAGEHREKANRHQRVSFDATDSDLSNIDGDAAAVDLAFEEAYGDTVMLPEDYAVNEEIKTIIAEQINSLSPEHREAMFLFYYQNKSIADIAERTGTNANNVKARLFHARKNIKKKLEELQKKGFVLCAVPFTQFVPLFKYAFGNAAGASSAQETSSPEQEAADSAPDTSAAAEAAQGAAEGTSATSAAGAAAVAGGAGIKAAIIAVAAVAAISVGALVVHNMTSDKNDDDSKVVVKAEQVGEAIPAEIDYSSLEIWQQQYIAHLEEMMTDDTVIDYFALMDLDGDDIPELDVSYHEAADDGSAEPKNSLFTFKNNDSIRYDIDGYSEFGHSAGYYRYVSRETGERYAIVRHDVGGDSAYYYRIDGNGISPTDFNVDSEPNLPSVGYEMMERKSDAIYQIVNYRHQELGVIDLEETELPFEAWRDQYIEMLNEMMTDDTYIDYFCLYDFDYDGIPEMDISYYDSLDDYPKEPKQAIFTNKNKNAVRIDIEEERDLQFRASYALFIDEETNEYYLFVEHDHWAYSDMDQLSYFYKVDGDGITPMEMGFDIDMSSSSYYGHRIPESPRAVNKSEAISAIENYGSGEQELIKPDIIEPYIPEPEEEQTPSAAELADWQKQYIEMIDEMMFGDTNIRVVIFDIDGDGIPEMDMRYDYNNEAHNAIFTFKNNKAIRYYTEESSGGIGDARYYVELIDGATGESYAVIQHDILQGKSTKTYFYRIDKNGISKYETGYVDAPAMGNTGHTCKNKAELISVIEDYSND